MPRSFWERADADLNAGSNLTGANDQIERAVRREKQDAARQEMAARTTSLLIISDHSGGSDDVIAMAASRARQHAEKAAVTEIGPGTVEQLKADVVRLGRAYVSAPPFPLFGAMHRALDRIQGALDQKTYPAQARDLNFLAGMLCGLMANASLDLSREEAADDLARAAWTYGRTIDHGPLMGWARGTQALAALWDRRYLDAQRHAQDGLAYVLTGAGAARLHAILARALSANGNHAQAQAAISAAENAHTASHRDELHDGVAGEFAFDEAKLLYYRALTLVDVDDPAKAESAAAAAIDLYQAAPARARSYGCEALARVLLARAQLMRTKLEEAAETLGGVLRLEPPMRISSLSQQLDACRELLHGPAFRESATAHRLQHELADFTTATAARALPPVR